ncbi:MAG: SH3 domain-containing protein [Myxococcota bacterium]|nr:SH3 domain-containing protein [Myxococcota bacterium]
MTRTIRLVFVGLMSLTLISCESMPLSKELMGTGAGAAVGGVIGGLAGDGNVLAIGAGVLVGGFIGNRVGKYLDDRDKELLAQSTSEALSTGSNQSFDNSETGVSGEVIVESSEARSDSGEIPVIKDRVESVPPLELVGEPYRAKKKINVRGGPGTDYAVVGSLPSGDPVHVVGRVKDQRNWFMISEGGAGSGFVYGQLLKRDLDAAEEVAEQPKPKRADVAKQSYDYSTQCRTVIQKVKKSDGEVVQEKIKACRGEQGWEAV